MKKNFFIWLLLVIVSSCSNDDNNSQNDDGNAVDDLLIGEWKLMAATQFGQTETITDYSNENITYTFKEDGIVSVEGGTNLGYEIGDYTYIFEEDFVSGAPEPNEPKILLIKIEGTKWIFSETDDGMTMGTSYLDGTDLIFERN